MVDGDTIFALSTGSDPVIVDAGDPMLHAPESRASQLNHLLGAAAECFAAACVDALVRATSAGGIAAYRDLCPSAFTQE
jgi:L-aminopeptidase/D-esterase-like protein